MNAKTTQRMGFTIVELLIVIVVIGILAAITIVAYNGVQASAQRAKINADLSQLSSAIQLAREETGKTLLQITGNSYTAGACASEPAGTNLATLPQTDPCWVNYLAALSAISTASGASVNNLVDPWGRPYYIDENEGESGGCLYDMIAAFANPTNGNATYSGTIIHVPHSGFTGCAP